MNYSLFKNKSNVIVKLFVILITCFLSCAYGYAGDLPNLGEESKPAKSEQQEDYNIPVKSIEKPQFPATQMFFPRIYSNYNINKYSSYLADIKQVEHILRSLKEVVKSDSEDKVQHFCAKVNVLDLYVKNLQQKYQNTQEKNYESFKQLVILDKYLMEAANYKRETDRYRKTLRGSLSNKLDDETYLRQKVDTSVNSIDAVLEIIQNAN